MGKIYSYKRVGFRKAALAISIFIISLVAACLIVAFPSDPIDLVPFIFMVFIAIMALYSSHKKTYITVGEKCFEIVGRTIPIDRISRIDIQEKRIDILVEKGILPSGNHIYMLDKYFDNIDDWNGFKKDMENLKSKL